MAKRQDVEFTAEGGVTLRGWLFEPAEPGPHPGITMAHGFAGVKEHGLERFARLFADAGFVVLVHDHRGFGASDGAPRYDVDPWVQIADWRRAISFLESHPAVDPERIGLWGTSYAGGHAIVLAGDSHAFWANELHDKGARRVAVEFGTTGVTSPGGGDTVKSFSLGDLYAQSAKEVVFCDQAAKGFVLLTLSREEAKAELMAVSTIVSRTFETRVLKTFRVKPEAAGVSALIEA